MSSGQPWPNDWAVRVRHGDVPEILAPQCNMDVDRLLFPDFTPASSLLGAGPGDPVHAPRFVHEGATACARCSEPVAPASAGRRHLEAERRLCAPCRLRTTFSDSPESPTYRDLRRAWDAETVRSWADDDVRWDGLPMPATASVKAAKPPTPGPWWHCLVCHEAALFARLVQLETRRSWTVEEMDTFDVALPTLRRMYHRCGGPLYGRWRRFEARWATRCSICGRARRQARWTAGQEAHTSCWKELQRRQRRQRQRSQNIQVTVPSDKRVSSSWDNGSRGRANSIGRLDSPSPTQHVSFVGAPLSTQTPTKGATHVNDTPNPGDLPVPS